MHIIVKRLIKYMVRTASAVLPEDRANDLERWRRGQEDNWKFKRCDYVFVSHGKSGRTWVRVMISRYLKLAHDGIPEGIILGFVQRDVHAEKRLEVAVVGGEVVGCEKRHQMSIPR